MNNSTKNDGAVFRFLKPKEYAALTDAEKARYLQQALEAITSGAPLDDLPLRELPPMEDDPGGGGVQRRTKATR